MSKKDKVFSFVEGLKLWAKVKFYEQRIQDFSTAYGTVELQFDLSNDQSQDERQNQTYVFGGNKNYRPNSSKGGGGDKLECRGEES